MMIRVYDGNTLDVLAIYTRINSVQWERYFYDIGNFEIRMSAQEDNLSHIKKGNIISHDGNSGIILYRAYTNGEIVIRGFDLKFFCKSRTIVPPFVYKDNPEPIDGYERIKGDAETVIKHYANTQMINPTDSERKIPNLVTKPNEHRGMSEMAWQAKFVKLDEELSKICKYASIGYDITFSPAEKTFTFDVIEGVDRTTAQNDVPPVMFCREYKNISESEYIDDSLSAINVVYVGANGEEEEQYVQEIKSEHNSLLRIEEYTSVSSDDVDEIDDTGLSFLNENKGAENVTGVPNSRLKYKEDWNIGDYVTSKIKAFGENIKVDEQIIGVREVYERLNTYATPIFDVDKQIIKRMLKG